MVVALRGLRGPAACRWACRFHHTQSHRRPRSDRHLSRWLVDCRHHGDHRPRPGSPGRGDSDLRPLVPRVSSELCSAAQDAYELFVEIQRLDSPDRYAGKLCAALDRQHPRDLFDVMHLQAAGPIPDAIRQAFVAYLACHRRPIAELLQPNRKPIEDLFANHFADMAEEPVELAELEAARTQLFEWAASALTDNERRFLLAVKQGEPDWSLLPFEGLDRWPAIPWKLHNI